MNIHVPASPQTEAELTFSYHVTKYNMISAQSSKPGIAIVQDSLVRCIFNDKRIPDEHTS